MTRLGAAAFAILLTLPCAAAAAETAAGKPVWAVDPDDPGPALPPAGRSLFDHLTMERRDGKLVQVVPFPFEALVAELRRKAGIDDHATLSAVLVPIGRSLQRDAANPEFFRFPRAVVAFDAEPAADAAASAGMVRDRLYLGYQEKAGVIEVISYNEVAGRFEFQVVRNYVPGSTPSVGYVERDECTACHQNQAPIFSRPLWQETSGDRRIAALLAARGDAFYGIPAATGVDTPNRLDDSTDRANLLGAVQRVWRQGCGAAEDDAATRCRADLLRAALRFRLSGRRHAAADDPVRRAIGTRLAESWRGEWPDGLAIPDPDIPNRDPLARVAPSVVQAGIPAGLRRITALPQDEAVRLAVIERALEPFNRRPPLTVWRSPDRDPTVLDHVIAGLADFFAAADIHRLDRLLSEAAATDGSTAMTGPVACQVLVGTGTGGDDDGTRTLKFRCRDGDDRSAFNGRVSGRPDDLAGKLLRFRHGSAGPLISVPLHGRLETTAQGKSLRLRPRPGASGLSVRLADGTRVAALDLDWADDAGNPTGRFVGTGTVRLSRESSLLTHAVERLAGATRQRKTDALSALPFRRAAVLAAMLESLGAAPDDWCCLDTAGMPAPKRDDL